MDPPLLSEALQFIREVKSNSAAAGDAQTYAEFLQTLKQYRARTIDSSIVNSTVKTLFTDNPNLLNYFNRFAPRHHSAAPIGITCAEFLNRTNLRITADFLNRVGNRFDGGGPYLKFLDHMHAYSRGKMDAAAVKDKAAGLFGKGNDDLLRELGGFFPKPREGEGSEESRKRKRKRKREADRTDERPSQRRSSDSGDGSKAWKRDNAMEDELCEIDMRIGRLVAARRNAVKLYLGVPVSAGVVWLREHFTAEDLACVEREGRKFVEHIDRHLVLRIRNGDCEFLGKVFELMEVLREKEAALKRMREKIAQRWNAIRQSR